MSRDRELRTLERQVSDDWVAKLHHVRQRAHVEGANVYLEVLRDRESWNAASESMQDMAISEVSRRVKGIGFELLDTRVYDCDIQASLDCKPCKGLGQVTSWSNGFGGRGIPNRHDCVSCGGRGWNSEIFENAHRLGVFRHLVTGAEFVLVPGIRFEWVRVGIDKPCEEGVEVIPSLLVARWPMTWGNYAKSELFHHWNQLGPMERPLAGLSYSNTIEYCSEVGLRLPTVQEWLNFAKAGAETRFYWGDSFDSSHVWYRGNSGLRECIDEAVRESLFAKIEEMGFADIFFDQEGRAFGVKNTRSHAPSEQDALGKWNAFGLVDVIGNVCEWIVDPAHNSPSIGGAYVDSKMDIWDSWLRPTDTEPSDVVGFRPVCDIPGIREAIK